MNNIERNKYLDLLKKVTNTNFIKILVGMRRVGKTSILNMHKAYLASIGVEEEQIWHVNFESNRFDHLLDGKKFQDELDKRINKEKKFYLFIDEVQEMKEWARHINSFKVCFNIDIYITGSNSHMFSGEHLTYLAGRYITINVYPLSFDEYLLFSNNKLSKNESYTNFLYSSFPEIVLSDTQESKDLLANNIRQTIIERDVVLRGKIRDESLFNRVAMYVFATSGNVISFKKIRDTLKSHGIKTALETVHNYVKLMENAFVIMHCPRYDEYGKKILKTNGKYYPSDIGIANLISDDKLGAGQKLEIFIFLELIKKGWKIYTMSVNRDYEIDFMAKKGDETIFVQVSEYIYNDEIWNRETRPFNYVKSNSPKYVVSFDWIIRKSDVCKHVNVFDFIEKYI